MHSACDFENVRLVRMNVAHRGLNLRVPCQFLQRSHVLRVPASLGQESGPQGAGQFVGGGRNKKTAARPEYSPSRSSPAQNYTRQAEQYTRQAPEPFRNPARAANPRGVESQQLNDPYARPAPELRPGIGGERNPSVSPIRKKKSCGTGHPRDYRPAGYTSATSPPRTARAER